MALDADSLLSPGHGRSFKLSSSMQRSKLLYSIIVILLLLFGSFHFFQTPTFDPIANLRPRARANTTSHLHLLVPATASNPDLCRLIASSTALGYPTPVLINWNAAGGKKESIDQHLAKVEGILEYLKGIPHERDDDLVLVIDGYDIIFQLRPDVLIGRYYDLIDASNRRLMERFGAKKMQRNGIYHSVVFGPDKACWPQAPDRAACWAAPESTLPRWSLGPETDKGRFIAHNRPRWLNSGTILGPIKDVRVIMDATLALIHKEYKDFFMFKSDQYWFAEIWAKQEYARILLGEGPLQSTKRRLWHMSDFKGGGRSKDTKLSIPKLAKKMSNEYHITLDYESAMFQTMSFQYDYFAWMLYNQSNTGILGPERLLDDAPFSLAEDILQSPFPLSAFDNIDEETSLKANVPSNTSWRSFALGTNTLTKNVFPMLHYTGPKLYREWWWPKLWYYPYIEDLLKAATSAEREMYGTTTDGRDWWAYTPEHEGNDVSGNGAFSDQGGFLTWRDLCKAHEALIFKGNRDRHKRGR